jgi:TP901 family phage tail tape measure protein
MDRDLRIRMLLQAADRVSKPLRDITAGSSKAAQALKATRDRLKEIERTQSQIGGFRQLKTGLHSTEQSLQAAQTRVGQLAQEMRATSSPTRQMTRDFEKAKNEARALTSQHESESRELQTMRDRLRAAGIATSDLARNERELRERAADTNRELQEQERRLTTVTNRQRRFSAAREQFGRMQGTATGLAIGGAAAMGTGMKMARPFLGGIEDAKAYQSAMTDIAQKADMSRKAGEKMGVGLLAAAKAANQMPADLQAGVDALAGFGLDPAKAAQMMRPIGRAATAYKAEIADLSKAAFAANDNLKVPIDQTQRVIDIMAQAGKSGAFEIKDMAQYFPTLTAGYQALGQTGTAAVADISAALQIARKGAGDSAQAATNIENVLQKIASPATIAKFKKFGVDLPAALKKAYAEGKTPLEAIAELTNKTLGGDLGKIGFLFEDAQVQQGLRPLIQNLAEYKRIRAQAAGASGTTDRDFAERMKDSAEQSKQLEINAKTLGITVGTMLLPTVNAVTQKLTAWTNWIGEAAQRHPMLAKGVTLLTVGLAALLIVLGGAGIVLAGLVAPIAALTTVATFFEVGLLPVIGVVAAVVAGLLLLGVAAYAIYANWGAIAGWFAGLWGSVKASFAGGVGAITAALINFSPMGLLYAAFAKLMGWLGVQIPADLATAGRNMILGLIGGITGMLASLKSTIVNAASSAATWFKEKLGIHSPSRVFMAFGGHLMTGLANGIDGGADAPVRRIDGLSRRLTAAMALGAAMPAVASAGPPRGFAPASHSAPSDSFRRYEIHLHAAPGMDESKLLDLLEQKLDEIERRDKAKRRSSFADQQDWSDHA